MIRRAVRRGAAVSAGLLIAGLVVACTGGQSDVGTSIGISGGTVSGDGGAVTLKVPPHAAARDSAVKIVPEPTVVPDDASGFVPLAGFDVDVTRGSVSGGQVSVRYTDAQLTRVGSDPGLLVILVSDHHGGWTPLPTRVNTATHTATARFPHFSGGELGALRKVGSWFVNHVATWQLGPEKGPNCTWGGAWLGPDNGWSVANTNWTGGRMLVNPLNACVELARPGSHVQHVDATNRYWYAFDLALPPNSSVSLGDASREDSFSDFLLDEIYSHFFSAAIIPGHSYAQFSVPTTPAGQVLSQAAIADPASIIVNAITSTLTVATLGELKVEEAGVDAAETELDEQLKGTENLIDAAETTAVGSDWRNSLDAKYDNESTARKVLDGYFNSYSVASCALDALKDYLPDGNSFNADVNSAWNHLGDLTESAVRQCWPFIVAAATGTALDIVTGNYSIQQGLELAKAFVNPKTIQGTVEAGLAAQAKEIRNANYYATKLIFTQRPSPGPASESVPVLPCDSRTTARSATLPPPVTLPPGAAVYGTTDVPAEPVTLSIAPAGYTCSALEGGDGSYVISVTAPGGTVPAISYGYSAGGAMINLEAICAYFPKLQAQDAQIRGGQANCRPYPKGEIVSQIATGDPHVLAAAFVDPPGTLPANADPSHGQYEAVGVVVAPDNGNWQGAASCVLTPAQRQQCIAGLSLFADQCLGAQDRATALAAIDSALSRL